tara:strand:- start:10 stop:957 length:948 start_codon:yes stop_codon:yes gene_type:complete
MRSRALIIGVKGEILSTEEERLIENYRPWGVILFSRNIKNILQLKKLINNIRSASKNKNYPILIDQEGGVVSRLNKIIDLSTFSQNYFTNLFKNKKKNFRIYYKTYIDRVSEIFREVGININTVPVLDIRRKHTHKVISNRCFSSSSTTASKIGKICIDIYKENKIATVMKHIPGHGFSKFDSHFKLPFVKLSKKELIQKDFKPFKECKPLFAMTAHVIYAAYDSINTATHSKIIIQDVIRKHMRFSGILISDDISMKALRYDFRENARKALNAGCNLIMHCNGNIKEMRELIKITPLIDKFTQKKTSDFTKLII